MKKKNRFITLILGIIICLACINFSGCQIPCTRHTYVLSDGKLVCSYCGEVFEDKTLHNYVNGVCTDCGKIEYAEFTNYITKNLMSANFAVYAKSSKYSFGKEESLLSQGSGVVYKKESTVSKNVYYLLTNNHVVVKEQGYTQVSYYVNDYVGNKIDNVTVLSADPKYDLAVVKVEVDKKSEYNYKVLSFAEKNPVEGEEVCVIGRPLSQANAITYGKVKGYCVVTTNDPQYKTDVTFPVINHTAYINNGSSGGLLMNKDFNIVGINYAGKVSEDNYYSIPLEKIIEYLTINNLL